MAQFMEDLAQCVGKSHQLESCCVLMSYLGDQSILLCLPPGNVSSHVAMGLRDGHRIVFSNTQHMQQRAQDVNTQLGGNMVNPIASSCGTRTPLGAGSLAHPNAISISSTCRE